MVFFDTIKEARFTMLVFYATQQPYIFPYRFPLQFGSAEIPILECLFKHLVPANVQVLFRHIDDAPIFVDGAFGNGFGNGFN